jgi:hypothetical protein
VAHLVLAHFHAPVAHFESVSGPFCWPRGSRRRDTSHLGDLLVAAYQWARRLASRELAMRNWQGHVWQGHVWNTVLAIILWLVLFYG